MAEMPIPVQESEWRFDWLDDEFQAATASRGPLRNDSGRVRAEGLAVIFLIRCNV